MHTVIVKDEKYKDLNPVQFGYEACEKSHFFGPAVRTHWLIHFVASGCGIYKIGQRSYNVKSGEMFVIPPFVETYYEADKENPWSYIWIGFTGDGKLPVPLSDVILCPEAITIFNAMKKSEDYTLGRSAYLSARLWDLFSLLSEENSKEPDYIERALEFIHSEYMHDITVEQIAKSLSLDRTYFAVIFKNKVGLSPKRYIINYRMNIASSLLKKNDVSVSVVANSVGYSDLYTFSKMFKLHFGISPKKYKETIA